MSSISCLLSKNKIDIAKEQKFYNASTSKNQLLKSRYKNDNEDFIAFNFSNLSLNSDIDICNLSGIITNFIGDITNRQDLINQLGLNKDVKNSTIISYAYKQWGRSFAKKIYGFFAIIIYETKNKSIIAINDHLGSKPLYFFKSSRNFLISSEINTILKMVDDKSPNYSRIRDYFIFFNGKPGETFFDGISRLEPGSQMFIRNNIITKTKYFDYDLTNKLVYKNDYEYEEHFKEIFTHTISALSNNLDKEEIGSSISGGLDSSSITCILKHLNKNVVPQSVLFEGLANRDAQMADERSYVNDVSKKYNLKVDYLPISNSGCISEYPDAIQRNDEPPSLINGYIHSAIFKNLKAKKIKILFDGFDGDTSVSHGYEHLFELGRKFKLFKLFKEYSDMHELYGVKKVSYMNAFKQYALKSYIPNRILWFQNKYKPTSMVPLEWYKKLNAEIVDPPSFKEVCSNYNGLPIPNVYSKNSQYAHYLDVINPTIEMSLNLINHSASSHGLDIKFPFMDRRLIEFCLSIPSSQKLKNGISRSILRRSLKNIIPDSIYNRHSKSDLSPFSRIEICNLSDERIMKSVLNIPFLDAHYIKNNLLKNKSKNMMDIYQIIIFDEWLKKNKF
jgi:asparagine synthase (glutamine-hydrolysing)